MSNNTRVLIVDDDESIRELLSMLLELHHYKTTKAHTDREGLNELKKQSFDLMIVDLMMPIMDGLHLIMMVRQELQLSIPILVLSGVGTREEIENKALQLGANKVLIKPIDVKSLLKEMDGLPMLGVKEMERSPMVGVKEIDKFHKLAKDDADKKLTKDEDDKSFQIPI